MDVAEAASIFCEKSKLRGEIFRLFHLSVMSTLNDIGSCFYH